MAKTAKQLSEIGKIADNALFCGQITESEHREIKEKIRAIELSRLFKAMAMFCKRTA